MKISPQGAFGHSILLHERLETLLRIQSVCFQSRDHTTLFCIKFLWVLMEQDISVATAGECQLLHEIYK